MSKLYPYQQKGVELIELYKGRVLLGDEQGLGKTIQVLTYLKQHPELRPAIIVCPATVKWVWQAQAQQHCGLRTTICQGRRYPKRGLLQNEQILIINYDILPHWFPYLRRLQPKLVALDEVHRIKSLSAKRTRAVRKLCTPTRRAQLSKLHHKDKTKQGKRFRLFDLVWYRDAKGHKIQGYISKIKRRTSCATIRTQIRHTIAMSGTPLTNRPAELYSTLSILWPKRFPAFSPFAWEFCSPRKRPWGGWDYSGAKNLDKLHHLLKECGMIRRLKKDVLKDLPPKTRVVVPLEIKHRAEYDRAVRDFIGWLQSISLTRAIRAKKAKELTKIGYTVRLAATLKMPAVFDWIDDFFEQSEDKLVVFCCQKAIVQQLKNRYPKISTAITGATTERQRRIAVERFQRDKKCRLFIGNIIAAGVGIDLWAANTVAFVETGFVPGDCMQGEDRLHRIGQTKPVTCYYLVARDTIEERLCEILQKKQLVITKTLDGVGRADTKLDIYKQLLRILAIG